MICHFIARISCIARIGIILLHHANTASAELVPDDELLVQTLWLVVGGPLKPQDIWTCITPVFSWKCDVGPVCNYPNIPIPKQCFSSTATLDWCCIFQCWSVFHMKEEGVQLKILKTMLVLGWKVFFHKEIESS